MQLINKYKSEQTSKPSRQQIASVKYSAQNKGKYLRDREQNNTTQQSLTVQQK